MPRCRRSRGAGTTCRCAPRWWPTLVATVVTLSGRVGPSISGILALFPAVFSSMMLILHPRIGGKATAAVIANSAWGLMGFGIAIVVLHLGALHLGSAAGLSLGACDLRELEFDAVVDRADAGWRVG